VIELNPTYTYLFGPSKKEVCSERSRLRALIKAGAPHQANGGYLVLPIEDLLRNPLQLGGACS
jgi:hypothetical protein